MENDPDRYELVLDLPAIKTKGPREAKTAVVIGGSRGWMDMIALMLGENLADVVLCGSDSASLDPNSIMRAGLAVNSGEKGILFLCSNDEQEMENFLYADSLLDEADIRSKVVFTRLSTAEPKEGIELHLTGNELFSVKVAGAAAACGRSLEEIYRLVRETRNYSNGIKVYLPEKYSLKNEVERIVFLLLNETTIQKGDTVCACMSGFGGIGYAELCVASGYVRKILSKKGIRLHDIVLSPISDGCCETALGFSLFRTNAELLEYYDKPCRAQFFQRGGKG